MSVIRSVNPPLSDQNMTIEWILVKFYLLSTDFSDTLTFCSAIKKLRFLVWSERLS